MLNVSLSSRMTSPSSSTDPQIKNLADIDKRYDQLGCLAHGGFSSVFLAKKRSSSGRKVAIKLFHMDIISKEHIHRDDRSRFTFVNTNRNETNDDNEEDHELPESFTREMKFVKKLQTRTRDWLGSSNSTSECDDRGLSIVFYEQWFSGQNFAGVVMNYCDGGTLAQEIDAKFTDNMPYSERRIAWYVLQLSEALAYSHERGVYHHDVKSSNILIDHTSGGKLLLADFGSAIGPKEESFSMTELYASPELQGAYANINNNNHDTDQPDGVFLDAGKVDSFGLGCIMFELICCRKLVDLTGEQTLAELIFEKGVETALGLECLKLPWLPNPHTQLHKKPDSEDKDQNQSNSQLIGYSHALRSLAETLLAPNPNIRWNVSQLQGPLKEDSKSPLLAKIVAASHSPVSGEPLTIDNVQLGMFVQPGRDWGTKLLQNSPFNHQYTVTEKWEGNGAKIHFHTITCMPEYEGHSFEELRLSHYVERNKIDAKADEVGIGVVVKLDPDGGYTEAIFPLLSSFTTLAPSTYRIGANDKFELQIGPSLEDFFAASERPKYTGLLSAKSLTRKLGKEKAEDLSVGHLLTNNCMLVAMDREQDLAIVAPMEKFSPAVSTELRTYYPLPTLSFVDPTKPQPPPEHWETNGNILVEEDNMSQRDAVTELFFSDGGGMDIQAYEIISIKRVQSIELWTSYSQSRVDIAAENWGVCNEHRLFLATNRNAPEQLLSDPASFFYQSFNSDGVSFSNTPSQINKYCYKETGSNDKQIVVSRVTLGRIMDHGDVSCLSTSHSIRKKTGKGVFCITNTIQAYPEYIITYRRLHDPTRTNHFDFSSRPNTNPFMHLPPPAIHPPATVSFSSQSVFSFSSPSQPVAPNVQDNRQPRFSFGSPTPHHFATSNNDRRGNGSNTEGLDASGDRQSGFYHKPRLPRFTPHGSSVPNPIFPFSSSLRPSTTTNGDNVEAKGSILNTAASNNFEAKRSTTSNAPASNNIASNQKRYNTEKEDEEKQISSTKQCVVCLEKDVRRICLPCGHPCLCEICSTTQGLRKLQRKCPECRGIIKQVVTIYARVVND